MTPPKLQPITIDSTPAHYDEVIKLLQLARDQRLSIGRGEGQRECACCGDNGHTCEECRKNPLVLIALGIEAFAGNTFRCFHCGAVFVDEQTASAHFGDDLTIAVECIRLRPEDGRARIKMIAARALDSDGSCRNRLSIAQSALESVIIACGDDHA